MSQILRKIELVPKIFEMVVDAPRIAKKAQAGQFVVVMADEKGERIPLTIADFDRQEGTLTMVLMVVGVVSATLFLSGVIEVDFAERFIERFHAPSEWFRGS